MTATHLMVDLDRLGIRLAAHGDRLRYWPRSAVTPDLADRMKAHKGELLAVLHSDQCRHIDSECYRDAPAPGRPGWIRTTCRTCDRFIGYRHAHDHYRRQDAAADKAIEMNVAFGSWQSGTEH